MYKLNIVKVMLPAVVCGLMIVAGCRKTNDEPDDDIDEPSEYFTEGDLQWGISDGGTLTIKGTGAIPHYTPEHDNAAPWYPKRKSIVRVNIRSGVTTIGQGAFYQFGAMTSITIPSSVTAIYKLALYNCNSLTEIVNRAAMPQGVSNDYVFTGVKMNACILRVPAGSLERYKTAEVWKDFKEIKAITE